MIRSYSLLIIVTSCIAASLIGCSKSETDGLFFDKVVVTPKPKITMAGESNESKALVTFTQIEWTDLLPDDDLEALENPPEYLDEIEDGSEIDQLSSQLNAESFANSTSSAIPNADEYRYQQALTSKNIRPEFDGRHIRIPGFIVPLEFDDHQTITTFFLVPFFGACIHMPPSPPNQIIYGEYEPGMKLDALYDPFWIKGTLSTTLVENDLATAAYSIDVSTIEPYYSETTDQWSDLD